MKRVNPCAFAVLPALALASLNGCAVQQSRINAHHQQAASIVATSPDARALWDEVLSELFPPQSGITQGAVASEQPRSTMPSLVAGDWLGVRCAVVGGYWDATHENGTPVFAEVPESWSQLD